MSLSKNSHLNKPKPFLKWVGGKTKLLPQIHELIINLNCSHQQMNYIEPFVGGGAVLFSILANFPNINDVIINDINENLINAYKCIQKNPQKLINVLQNIEFNYHQLSLEQQKQFYLSKRNEFNSLNCLKHENEENYVIEKTALLLFLNKTCFNGLYRVNKQGKFNVPFGKYKQPTICPSENIMNVHQYLQKVKILQGDFLEILSLEIFNNINKLEKPTLFYLDPPYKPINSTSDFTAYTAENFDDQDQLRLKLLCDKIHEQGCYFILSNSDVKNFDQDNNFFDELYGKYHIQRVKMRRNINCQSDKRGEIFELLISNF